MISINRKKILIIVGFISLIISLGFLLYITFFSQMIDTPINTPIATSSSGVGGLPIADDGSQNIISSNEDSYTQKNQNNNTQKLIASDVARGGLTKTTQLNKTRSSDVVLSSNGKNIQYYNNDDGKFYYIDSNGKIDSMSDKVFHNVEKTTWSSDGNQAILEYPDGSNIVYSFDTGKQVTLPKHWEDFEFSSNGNKIAMKSIGLDPSNRYLAIANSDGSKTKIIDKIGNNADDVYPSWSPNDQVVALFTEGIDFNRQEVFFIGQNGENFKSTVIEGRGFQPQWSPSGEKLLYSVYSSDNEMKPSLWLVNSQGEQIGSERKSLRIETWAEKCNFHSASEIYCAVPNKLEEGAGLFPELAKNTTDKLYRIDVNTGAKKLIAIPENDYNVSNIIISDDGKYLYFTDEKTSRIHKINLK